MIQASVVRVAGSVRKGKATVMATTNVQDPSSVAWTTAIDQSKILGLQTMTAVLTRGRLKNSRNIFQNFEDIRLQVQMLKRQKKSSMRHEHL